MTSLLNIARGSFGDKGEDRRRYFLDCHRRKDVVVLVAVKGPKVVGYLIYQVLMGRLKLLEIAVHPEHRSSGVGCKMLSKVIHRLIPGQNIIEASVNEVNLQAQQFLRRNQFKAVGVSRGHFDNRDAYEFEYTMQAAEAVA